MQEKYLYEYAVIRFVPKVEREEFINVGIIMYCKRPKFLKARYNIDEQKLHLFPSELEKESLCANLKAFEQICSATSGGGYVASLDITERYRWLTAVRSTSIQTSRSNMGFADDLDATFDRLYQELVL